MTVQSGFFSDGSSYNQADFNAFLLDSIGSGYVLGYENELRVTQNSPANMGVRVRTGRCYVQGYYGWVTSNEALTVPAAHTTLPRIDRVVARLSVSVNQSVTFAIKTGTPAASPSAPTLTRTSETYEISLARIYVGAGVTSITAANITDERGDATVCGVAGVKHSWQYLTNVAIDVSGMSVDAGVSDRDPVYFNGTKWVVSTSGAVGFYDYRHDAVITAGYLDGFTGLTPGEIVSNKGVALSATEIVVLETPVDTNGVKQVGDIAGNLTGLIKAKYTIKEKDTEGALTLGEVIPAVSASAASSSFPLEVTIIDGLQAILAAKTALPSVHTIIKPTGCIYPFDIAFGDIIGGILSVVASDIDGITLKTWTIGAGLSLTCAIPEGTDKIVATITSQHGSTPKSFEMPAYYATFS